MKCISSSSTSMIRTRKGRKPLPLHARKPLWVLHRRRNWTSRIKWAKKGGYVNAGMMFLNLMGREERGLQTWLAHFVMRMFMIKAQ